MTLFHAFVTLHIDYCNAVFAGAPKSATDRLQRVLNATALSHQRHSDIWLGYDARWSLLSKCTLLTAAHWFLMSPVASVYILPVDNIWSRGTVSACSAVGAFTTDSFKRKLKTYLLAKYWRAQCIRGVRMLLRCINLHCICYEFQSLYWLVCFWYCRWCYQPSKRRIWTSSMKWCQHHRIPQLMLHCDL